MKILNEKPPMLEDILGVGMNPNLDNVIFTYGDTIYNPSGRYIPDYLIEHESVHTKQQGDDPDAWWDRYLRDPYFRLDQELDAYARQYWYTCQKVKDRNKRNLILIDIAKSVSGETYGNMVRQPYAMQEIKKRAKV